MPLSCGGVVAAGRVGLRQVGHPRAGASAVSTIPRPHGSRVTSVVSPLALGDNGNAPPGAPPTVLTDADNRRAVLVELRVDARRAVDTRSPRSMVHAATATAHPEAWVGHRPPPLMTSGPLCQCAGKPSSTERFRLSAKPRQSRKMTGRAGHIERWCSSGKVNDSIPQRRDSTTAKFWFGNHPAAVLTLSDRY
jgi:hypothetical protein